MNERIRQLADKIWEEKYWTNPNTDRLLPAQLNRFAELIVKECINEVEGLQVSQSTLDWSQHWNRAIAHTALHLKEHFGVEE